MLKAENVVSLVERGGVNVCSGRGVAVQLTLSGRDLEKSVSVSRQTPAHCCPVTHTKKKTALSEKETVKSLFHFFFFFFLLRTTSVRCNLSAKVPPVLPDAAGGGAGCLFQT